MALSKNFKEETSRRDKPGCFGKYKITSVANKLKCGTCWFCHECKIVVAPKKVIKEKVDKK